MAKPRQSKLRSRMGQKKAPSNPLGDLGRLPPELRNEIYKLALTANSSVIISRSMFMKSSPDAPRLPSKKDSSKVVYTPRGTITTDRRTRKARREVKVAAASVLATGLLCASKSINEEATAIFYSLNTFHFSHGLAAREFFEWIGDKGALLTRVCIDLWKYQWSDELRYFNRMKKLKQIDLTGRVLDEDVSVGWQMFECMVAKHEVLQTAGKPHMVLELPEELQLKRLDAFHFQISSWSRFYGYPRNDTAEAAARRSAKYKALLTRCLQEEAAKAREEGRAKEQAIRELLQEGRALK